MRADLIDSPHVERVAALEAELEATIAVRVADEKSLAAATTADSEALTRWIAEKASNPDAQPSPRTAPKAEEAVEAAKRMAVATLKALQLEKRLLADDVAERADEIKASLAEKEDFLQGEVIDALDGIQRMLSDVAEIRAHRAWLKDPGRPIGNAQPQAERELSALRKAVSEEETETAKVVHERRRQAWDELVARATATVPRSKRVPVLDTASGFATVPLVDAAIEAEYERLIEEGEQPPQPMSEKWAKKLHTGRFAKPGAVPAGRFAGAV